MADIARLFLDGARPLPVRTPPAWRTLPPTQATPASSGSPAPAEHKPGDAPSPAPVHDASAGATTTVLGLASASHDSATWKLLVKAAQGLADEQSTTVALVGLFSNGGPSPKTSFVMDVVGVESAEELPAIRTAHEAGGGGGTSDMQIARALNRLRPAIGLWIIAAPSPESRAFPAVASIVREWLLACPTDNDALITGYQHLKHAWTAAAKDNPISTKVYLLTEDYAQAAVVHKRLRQAALEFLGTDLALAGAGPIRHGLNGGGGHEPIRILSMACQGPEDALWAAILDELCPMTETEPDEAPVRAASPRQVIPVTNDIEAVLEKVAGQAEQLEKHSAAASAYVLDHLAQVLDPEERAALAADFEEPGVAVARPRVREIPLAPVEARVAAEEKPAPVVIKQTTPHIDSAPVSPATAVPGFGDARNDKVDPVAPVATPVVAPVGENDSLESTEADGGDEPRPLRVFDLEEGADRAALWQAVERSIWNLSPRSALLDAKPPMSWATDTCLSIDSAGRVNVWTLYRDGTSWFALREWANEHRNLLALTRRDLVIDKEADVAVHIVLPLDYAPGEGPDVVPTLLRTAAKNIHLYRLRQIQWNGRRGLLVVPIG